MNRRTLNHFVLTCVLILGAAGCDFMSMESVPDPELINNWVGDFLVESDEIKGVYRNLDVDSLVFTYHTAVQTEAEFRNVLSAALRNSGWKEATASGDFIEYRRFFQKGESIEDRPDMASFFSYEVIRIAFVEEAKKVAVAYVQADSSKDVQCFEETREGKWAERVIWPKFEQLRKK